MAAIFFQMGSAWFHRVPFGNDTLMTIWSQTQRQPRAMGHVIRTAKVICSMLTMLTMLMSHYPTAELEQNQQQQDQIHVAQQTHTDTHRRERLLAALTTSRVSATGGAVATELVLHQLGFLTSTLGALLA